VPVVGGGEDPFPTTMRADPQIRAIVQQERDKKKAATAGAPITQPQMKMLGATARRKGLTVAEDVRQFVVDVVGRDVTGARDLTKAEASQVIDKLGELPDKAQP